MSRVGNSHYLLRAAAARHRDTHHRANQAIQQLDRQGQPITFAAVAATANVSRTWLYRQDDLRQLPIRRLRADNSGRARTPATHRASNASLRQRLEAARDEIAHLREANAELRQRLEHHLGEQSGRRSTGP